jgi:1,4-dihydroxy-2-naphthoate polyprenyltransferase
MFHNAGTAANDDGKDANPMKVLVILGHPRRPSLCAALAEAYAQGARAAGMDVQALDLAAMDFDPDVHAVSPLEQPLEPDLERARQLIEWCNHLVFVFPGWWGVGPARLKGFLDRVLLPGFAFRERHNGGFVGLLGGRTAHLITTLDMPPWVYRVIYRANGQQALKRSALGFCGIETTRILTLGPVKDSSGDQRRHWLNQARSLGLSLRSGPRSVAARVAGTAMTWARALRLQFYPMTWVAYTVGALGAAAGGGHWNAGTYWLGYAFIFFLEAATVFSNERFDFDSDRRNQHYGPFNGGSRVLVDGLLTTQALTRGIIVTLAVAFTIGGLLLIRADGGLALPMAMAVLAVLALGYTTPPLKLAWRGLGELDVAATHGPGVVLIGYLLLGGASHDAFPWLVSLPLFLAVLPSITLSGIPDLQADRLAGKRTVAVRLGRRCATQLAIAFALAAALAVLLLKDLPALQGSFNSLLPVVLAHALVLVALLWRDLRRPRSGRIDALMVVALSYSVWFGLIPLLQLR